MVSAMIAPEQVFGTVVCAMACLAAVARSIRDLVQEPERPTSGPCTRGLSQIPQRPSHDQLQLRTLGAASLAEKVPWNPMFVYEVPAAIDPS